MNNKSRGKSWGKWNMSKRYRVLYMPVDYATHFDLRILHLRESLKNLQRFWCLLKAINKNSSRAETSHEILFTGNVLGRSFLSLIYLWTFVLLLAFMELELKSKMKIFTALLLLRPYKSLYSTLA